MTTTIPLRKWMAMAGLAIVTLSAAPVNVHFFDGTQTAAVTDRSVQDIVTGRVADEITRLYDDNFLFRDGGIDLFGMLSYTLFREGRRGVLVGADGFLFSSEEYESSTHAKANLAANVDFIANSARVIESSGAKLLVAVVPAKARIYADERARYIWPSEPESRMARAMELIQRKHIGAIDLSDTLQNAKASAQVFFATDTHWTSDGAASAAAAIARRACALSDICNEALVTMSSGKPVNHLGDLTHFLRLGPFQNFAGPKADTLVTWSANVDSEETLLGETNIPVALVGTSYSADARWSFHAFLVNALKSDVLNVADEGKGPFVPMTEYLSGIAFRDSPPKLVIWEIPERYLDDPLVAETKGPQHG